MKKFKNKNTNVIYNAMTSSVIESFEKNSDYIEITEDVNNKPKKGKKQDSIKTNESNNSFESEELEVPTDTDNQIDLEEQTELEEIETDNSEE